MPPKVVNASTITGPTMKSVVCQKCRTAIEWKRRQGGLNESHYDLLWCSTCQSGKRTDEIVPPGAVVLVFD